MKQLAELILLEAGYNGHFYSQPFGEYPGGSREAYLAQYLYFAVGCNCWLYDFADVIEEARLNPFTEQK